MKCPMRVRYVLYLLLIISVFAVDAQRKKDQDTSALISQPGRVEFNIFDFTMQYDIINGEDNGLLVYLETEDRTDEGYNWTFNLLDTTLNQVWTRILPIPFDTYLTGTEYHDGKYYLLFNASRYRNEDLLLIELDAQFGEIRSIEINTVFPIQLTFFEVIDDNILLSGYTNFRPVLLTFNLNVQKPRVVPGFYDNKSDIIDIVIDDESHMFTVIQSEKMINNRYTMRAKTFTSEGDLIQNNIITPGEKKNLVDGASTSFYGGFQYVAGTYSKKPSQYSRGLYLTKFVNGRQQFVKYHDYADLNNFFGYMNSRREQRIKERIERKKEKGKKPKFSYRLLVHDIIQRGDEYLMIAEAYYPRYSSYSSPGSYGSYNNSYTSYNPSFMGYKYTHAIVVAFDRNGNIIWDNSFGVDDIETYSLEEFVAVSQFDDKTVLMYLEENTIRSKVVQGNEIYEGMTFNPVKLAYEADEVKSRDPAIEGLKNWYGNVMYAYGEQRIQNDEGEGGRTSRKVFYINKITYNLGQEPN
ncbi:MAG: hypothetical protein CMP48_16445 [Rickettsiales bacterium]|nr:hypothetical protein [Rickettsiales bacterium]